MPDAVEPLILDLLKWIGREPRSYAEVIEAWQQSRRQVPAWEEAKRRGLVERHHVVGTETVVRVSAAGRAFVDDHRAVTNA